MPALPPYLIEPIFEQFSALLPQREVNHPLGSHRPRIPSPECSSRSSFRYCSSAAPTAGSPTSLVRPPRFAADATSASKRG